MTIAVAVEITEPARGFAALSDWMQSFSMYLIPLSLLSDGLPPGFVTVRTTVEALRSGSDLSLGIGTIGNGCLECCAIVLAGASYPVVALFAEFWSRFGGFGPSPSIASIAGIESVAGVTGHTAFVGFLLATLLWLVSWAGASVRGTTARR